MNLEELMPLFTWASSIFTVVIVIFVIIKGISGSKNIKRYVKYSNKVYNEKQKQLIMDDDPFKDFKDPWEELDKKVGKK
jgi:hypothetical protein